MKVLIVGSGGREHALAWKIAQSPQVDKIFCAPGNGGTGLVAKNVGIPESDILELANFASMEKIDLTVVGPEIPLTLGIVDEFEKRRLRIFGPTKKAAEIEGSKVFAKQFMERHKIPTARFRVTDSFPQAQEIIKSGEFSYPLVIKADGLAAGKGALVCATQKKAWEAVYSMMIQKKFGNAGRRIVIEEYLEGKEASFMVICDGSKVQPLVTTMDHKAVYDGDKGPNTGGMGAISPSPFIDQQLFTEIMNSIIYPTVTRMLEEGRRFRGVLYAGLMLTERGPKVLEFNCRFGDPETQAQVLRIENDLVDVLLGAIEEDVLSPKIKWSERASGCVVLASGGYPQKYETGKVIEGLEELGARSDIVVFHAGTKYEAGRYFTSGGRVLGVCASENSLSGTMAKIYDAISRIRFDKMHYRRDIGAMKEEK